MNDDELCDDDLKLVNIPPAVEDDMSDEDEADDDGTGSAIVHDVPGTVEVHFRREEEQEDEPAAPVKKKRKFDKSAPVWKPVNPVYCGWGVMSDTA